MLLEMREAADKGWLFIVDGGLCEFRLRLDKQITIYTIVSAKPGVGLATARTPARLRARSRRDVHPSQVPHRPSVQRVVREEGFRPVQGRAHEAVGPQTERVALVGRAAGAPRRGTARLRVVSDSLTPRAPVTHATTVNASLRALM